MHRPSGGGRGNADSFLNINIKAPHPSYRRRSYPQLSRRLSRCQRLSARDLFYIVICICFVWFLNFYIIGISLRVELYRFPRNFRPHTSIQLDSPASEWKMGFPVGNGRLGGMVHGSHAYMRITLNDEKLYGGGYVYDSALESTIKQQAYTSFQAAREYLNNEQLSKAQTAAEQYVSLHAFSAKYEYAGELTIRLEKWKSLKPKSYFRALDMATGTVHTTSSFQSGEIYTSDVFVSQKDNVLIAQVALDDSGESFAADILLTRIGSYSFYSSNSYCISGDSSPTINKYIGIPYTVCMKVSCPNFSCSLSRTFGGLKVSSSEGFIVYVTSETAAKEDVFDAVKRLNKNTLFNNCQRRLNRVTSSPLKSIWTMHTKVHNDLFKRSELVIKEESENYGDLTSKMYSFGRYLLIASSHPKSQMPANLQGIWSDGVNPLWNCDFHLNINLQMAYWAVFSTNLAECSKPLNKFLFDLSETGSLAASLYYNISDGWVAHGYTDFYLFSGPRDATRWNLCISCGAWLSLSLYEQYRFTQDVEFLRKAFPIMKGALEFLSKFSYLDKNGYFALGPSTSPENSYRWRLQKQDTISVASLTALDFGVLMALLEAVQKSSEILNEDVSMFAQLSASLSRTVDKLFSKESAILEWMNDECEEVDPGHRHFSHLFSLAPGWQVLPGSKFGFAASNSLKRRLAYKGGHTGWSAAWAVNLHARLGESEQALTMLKQFFRKYTLKNLLAVHPSLKSFEVAGAKCETCFQERENDVALKGAFQIDGNLGLLSGITEMILQSHLDQIQLLPAIPSNWRTGYALGLRARGAVEISLFWENGALINASFTLQADRNSQFHIQLPPNNRNTYILKFPDASTQLVATESFVLTLSPSGTINLLRSET